MNRKTLIACLSIVCAFIVLVTVSLCILYSGKGDSRDTMMYDREFALMSAVPSDAAAVIKTSSFQTLLKAISSPESSLSSFLVERSDKGSFTAFADSIHARISEFPQLADANSALSVHYIGNVYPLLLLDAGKAGQEPSEEVLSLTSLAQACGVQAKYVDISFAPLGNVLRKRSVLMLSPSDILIEASVRHLRTAVSILDAEGFSESIEMLASEDMVILPKANFKKIASEVISRQLHPQADFLSKFADCVAFDLTSFTPDHLSLRGKSYAGTTLQNFLNVYSAIHPSRSEISRMIPSYTLFAAAVPFGSVSEYEEAYLKFAETRSLSKKIQEYRTELKKRAGIDPLVWASGLDIKEAGVVAFRSGADLEKVLLIRVGNESDEILFGKDSGTTLRNYDLSPMPYRYKGFAAALFGSLFSLEDESTCLYLDHWLVVGSPAAIAQYHDGRVLEYPLRDYLSDAGVEDRLSLRDAYFVSYFSLSEDPQSYQQIFRQEFLPAIKASCKDISFEPIFLTVSDGRSGMEIGADLYRTVVLKSQAPVTERDTLVVIPKGPFKVKNSGTGKTNLFYQQENNYLCLKEEGGKGLWGVPFSRPIAGCAQTVDFFNNGKLQILFGAGSQLHLIDRLGRFVNHFPVDLKKEILIGPDVYDFSGQKKYNVMVLHKDNTIEMYNLQGKRPAEWKTITSDETIKGLPERIYTGGRTYWVVRTSIQTLIFGFYGGEPLTVYKGDRMIRPDTRIDSAGDGAVEVTCYDGKQHVLKLKN